MPSPRRQGVLLVNVGSPDAPTAPAVRSYLRTFLTDRHVLSIPAIVRYPLVYGVIAPLRASKSAQRYQRIWTTEGSPLVSITRLQVQGLASRLEDVSVKMAMACGAPFIHDVIKEFEKEKIEHLVTVPMFPQYAAATTFSAREAIERAVQQLSSKFEVTEVPPFFENQGFIQTTVNSLETCMAQVQAEHVLLSYHGLPVRQLLRSTSHRNFSCEKDNCAVELTQNNADCYQAQCYATSRLISQALKTPVRLSTSFQSRIRGETWLGPHTDQVAESLAKSGVKRLAVACPSFVADCLETLEEIQLELREKFLAAGGEAFVAVPCVNDSPSWLDALAKIVERHLKS